ncbi:AraC family transcriptional regulator [Chryseobacterium sp.]|uniref:helix-turn-helix domain-containing protein n=1 Tax=Chryseobacterium sp. TaxID=1871047 RepID=UPI0028963B8D|nr:AraC family transcriptional regulator [Chryseobacterium sp.]
MENTDPIETLKRNMIINYLKLMMIIMFFYCISFFVGGFSKTILIYIAGGIPFLLYLIYLVNRISFIKVLLYVKIYLFVAPIYCLPIIIFLFSISVVSIVWFLPLPLGAYILLDEKKTNLYAAYSLLLGVAGIGISLFFNSYLKNLNSELKNFISFTDITAIIFNGFIILVFIRYKDKIDIVRNQQKQIAKINNKDVPDNKIIKDVIKENEENYLAFFNTLDDKMTAEKWFVDTNLNISKICIALNTNATYVSRAIRAKGYTNFNHYLNTVRVNHVKFLLKEKDLSKITLLYIYTEAGFSNQPTFNRVFKQIERVTPSEYIKKHLFSNE